MASLVRLHNVCMSKSGHALFFSLKFRCCRRKITLKEPLPQHVDIFVLDLNVVIPRKKRDGPQMVVSYLLALEKKTRVALKSDLFSVHHIPDSISL